MILKMIFKRKRGWTAVLFFLLVSCFVFSQGIIDMSESILKVQEPVMIYDLGDSGFAVYDVGDSKLKIFNWDFKYVRQLPLKKGEGPGEIKSIVTSVCLVEEKYYIMGLFEKSIKVFNTQGILDKEIPLDFMPKDIVHSKDKLYAFSININASAESFTLGAIIEPHTGKKVKEISIYGNLLTKKEYDGNPMMLGLSSTIDVTDKGEIFLIISGANILAAVNSDGKVLYKMELPYKERKVMKTVNNDGEKGIEMSILDWYPDMRAFNDGTYICFLKTVTKSNSREKRYQTVLIKVKDKDKFSEKTIEGNFIIIGKQKGVLQLFETEEYKIIGIELSEWQ